MELVLSPGTTGTPTDGSPFRNEDVQEWSRVDRITGMLERARVETDRWRANTREAAHSYGKMIDSRERNSADGSLVQKARRQVEIFQSQGVSGRNIQVVRASQWSSSKATGCTIDIPINKPDNTQGIDGTMNGDLNLTPRLSLWRPSLAETSSDLDHLSYLCRKLHDEAMSKAANFWPLRGPSPLPPLDGLNIDDGDVDDDDDDGEDSPFQEIETQLDLSDDRLSSSSLGERRSNSTEDVSSLVNEDFFARDCKMRRSLQISNNSENGRNGESNGGSRGRRRAELIVERAKRFEEGASEKSEDNSVKKRFISTKTFTPIANNDFIKNDPKHSSKISQFSISIQDNGQTSPTVRHVSSPVLSRAEKFIESASTRKANNRTVVHLRNAASPINEKSQPPRCINVTAIKVEKKDSEGTENGNYFMLKDSKEGEAPITSTRTFANGTKPVKKVEFCKTEVHFAADSGKVNIVETDGKPPPSNKFRRRRRNNSLNSAGANNLQKSNMPLVHFGDTSYEKYIFGGKLPQDLKTDNPVVQENNRNHSLVDADMKKDRWDAQERIKENGIISSKEIYPAKDSYVDAKMDAYVDHSGKQRGTHTTTVNFLSDESKALVPRISEGGLRTRNIQLQFSASGRSLSPIHSDDEANVVKHTTKITVHLPPVISTHHHHHPAHLLQNINQFSHLKSVRLVMSIGRMLTSARPMDDSSIEFGRFFSEFTERNSKEEPSLLALRFKTDDDCAEDGEERILDESRMIMDKPSNASKTPEHVDTKSEILPVRSQYVSVDSENDRANAKLIPTRRAALARVQNDGATFHKSRSKNDEHDDAISMEKGNGKTQDAAVQTSNEAKDYCDTRNGTVDHADDDSEVPLYENIFDAVSDDSPLYENFQVVKTTPLVLKETTPIDEKSIKKKPIPDKMHVDARDRKQKLLPKANREASVGKSSKTRAERLKTARSITPMSDRNSIAPSNNPEKSRGRISSRSSNSRDSSIKRHKDGKSTKEDIARSSQTKRKSSSVGEKVTPTTLVTAEKTNGSVKTKKPVEIVYQTAVYNMKNEKLSKPKTKEVKGPRLINELICGSKLKPDNKKVIKTAIVLQDTSKRKEASAVLNR